MNRSPIAERVFKRELEKRKITNIEVDSYALQGFILPPTKGKSLKDYPKEYAFSLPYIKKLKISMEDHISKPLTKKVMKNSDIIITMSKEIHDNLLKHFPEFENKTFLISSISKTKVDLEDVDGSNDENMYKRTIENTEKLVLEIFGNILKKLGEEIEKNS